MRKIHSNRSSRYRPTLVGAALIFTTLASVCGQQTVTYNNGDVDATNYNTSPPNNPTTLTINSGAATQSGVLSGLGSVLKDGAGTLTLTGTNTFLGSVTVNNGTLIAGSNSALGNQPFFTIDGATSTGVVAAGVGITNRIDVNNGGSLRLDGAVTGNRQIASAGGGSIQITGSGVIDRTAAFAVGIDMTGGGTVTNAGEVDIAGLSAVGLSFGAGTSRLNNSGDISVLGGLNASVQFADPDSVFTNSGNLLSNGVGGVGVLFMNGGTLENSGNISESNILGVAVLGNSSPVTVNNRTGATISAQDPSSFDDRAILLVAGGTILNESGATINSDDIAIQASAALQLTNAGTINGDVLTSAADDQLTLLGGVIDGDVALGLGNNALILGGDTGPRLFSGAITGTLTGLGTLTKNGTNTWILDRDLAPPGETTVSAGTLQIGNGGTTGSLAGDVVDNGTLAFNRSDDIGFGGTISGTGTLVKQGIGTLTLTAANTYTGDTVINTGTLAVPGSITSPSGQIVVGFDPGDDATLDVNGPGSVSGVVVGIAGSASSTGIARVNGGTLTSSGALLVGGGGNGTLEINSGGTVTNATGFVGFQAGSVGIARVSGGSWTNTDTLIVGSFGTGTLEISGTGQVTSPGAIVGFDQNANGTVTVNGGSWNNQDNLIVGLDGSGTLVVNGTGTVENSSGFLGLDSGSVGIARVSGGTWTNVSGLTIGAEGEGRLDLSGGIVNAASIRLADETGSTGTLNIGTGGAPGILNTSSVTGGNGTPTLNFNHNSADYAFTRASLDGAAGTTAGTPIVIAGTTAVRQIGPGRTILTGTNTYSGGTTITDGTLTASRDENLGDSSGSVTIAGGTLESASAFSTSRLFSLQNGGGTVQATADLDLEGTVSGDGQLTKSGSGTLILTGQNTYSGGTAITNGTLAISRDENLGARTGLVTFDGGTLKNTAALETSRSVVLEERGGTLRTDADLRLNAPISGSGGLTKTGSSILTLSGQNTYSGGTTVSDGTLAISRDENLGARTGRVIFNGGTLQNTAALTTSRRTTIRSGDATIQTNAPLLYQGVISGPGALTKIGAGTLALAAANAYSGGTTLRRGTLQTTNTSALGSGPLTINSGTLDPAGRLSVRSLNWRSGTIATQLGDSTDLVTIRRDLRLDGKGRFRFTPDTGFDPTVDYLILTARNLARFNPLTDFIGNRLASLKPIFTAVGRRLFVTFQPPTPPVPPGPTSGPLLQNSAPVNVPTTADFTVDGLVTTGTPTENNTIKSLRFQPGSSLQIFNTLTATSGELNALGGTSLITGDLLRTPGNLRKTGPGTFITSNDFLVGESTLVQSGGLLVNGTLQSPSGVEVSPGALLGGSGLLIGNVTNGGTLAPGNSPGNAPDTLSIAGDFTQTASGQFELKIANPTTFDRLFVTGTAALAGSLRVTDLGQSLTFGQQIPFLFADRITGDFDRLDFADPTRYRGRFLADSGTGTLLIAPTSYTLVAETQNQRNVARALDSFIGSSDSDRDRVSLALDFLTADGYPAAFDQISPAFHQSIANIELQETFTRTQLVNQRLSSTRLGATGFQLMGLDEEPLTFDKNGKASRRSERSLLQRHQRHPHQLDGLGPWQWHLRSSHQREPGPQPPLRLRRFSRRCRLRLERQRPRRPHHRRLRRLSGHHGRLRRRRLHGHQFRPFRHLRQLHPGRLLRGRRRLRRLQQRPRAPGHPVLHRRPHGPQRSGKRPGQRRPQLRQGLDRRQVHLRPHRRNPIHLPRHCPLHRIER